MTHQPTPERDEPDDGTLGGYLKVHNRPPAYHGPDGHPYTVSVEVERTGNLVTPYLGYLVFPRWAQTGVGIVGHVETPVLVDGRSQAEVEERLGTMTLLEVQEHLEAAVAASDDTPSIP